MWLAPCSCLLNWRSLPFGRTCINVVGRCDRLIAVHRHMVHHCKHPHCRAVERIRLANYTIMIIRWAVDTDTFKLYLDIRLTKQHQQNARTLKRKMKFDRTAMRGGHHTTMRVAVCLDKSETKMSGQYHFSNQFIAKFDPGN